MDSEYVNVLQKKLGVLKEGKNIRLREIKHLLPKLK